MLPFASGGTIVNKCTIPVVYEVKHYDSKNATVDKVNLLDLDRKSLRAFFTEMGEKPFRAEQVMKRIYQQGVDDFTEMTNLNKNLRAKLQALRNRSPRNQVHQQATDGTIKFV